LVRSSSYFFDMKLLTSTSALLLAVTHLTSGASTGESLLTPLSVRHDANTLQDIVTWDSQSLKIHGEKLMIYSAEFHPSGTTHLYSAELL
jgi:hypothetical protein